MDVASPEQATVLRRFVEACQSDQRIIAAFVGGSFAGGTADRYSDLDLYVVVASDAYAGFFAERQAFMRQLGEPVFMHDFNAFGFDMLLFTYADGVEGELALAPDDNFDQIHGGPYRVLVDKAQVLTGKAFPLLAPSEEQQRQTLRHLITWFWEELSHFTTALNRGQVWLAYSYLEQTRRTCVNLAHLRSDFTREPAGYGRVEQDLPADQLRHLSSTFCPLESAAMLRAVDTICAVYRQNALPLANDYGIEYPAGLDRVLGKRLEQLRSTLGSTRCHIP